MFCFVFFQLESLITDVFKGKGFQKISELFQEKEICPPQKFSKQLFNQLDKVLKKASNIIHAVISLRPGLNTYYSKQVYY